MQLWHSYQARLSHGTSNGCTAGWISKLTHHVAHRTIRYPVRLSNKENRAARTGYCTSVSTTFMRVTRFLKMLNCTHF